MLLTATDDSHFRIQDYGGGWVMVAADALTGASLIRALKEGRFYASTGASIDSLELDRNRLIVRCSPVSHICVSGCQTFSMSRNGDNLTFAEFDLSGFDSNWFRVTLCDRARQMAWSNPYWYT